MVGNLVPEGEQMPTTKSVLVVMLILPTRNIFCEVECLHKTQSLLSKEAYVLCYVEVSTYVFTFSRCSQELFAITIDIPNGTPNRGSPALPQQCLCGSIVRVLELLFTFECVFRQLFVSHAYANKKKRLHVR